MGSLPMAWIPQAPSTSVPGWCIVVAQAPISIHCSHWPGAYSMLAPDTWIILKASYLQAQKSSLLGREKYILYIHVQAVLQTRYFASSFLFLVWRCQHSHFPWERHLRCCQQQIFCRDTGMEYRWAFMQLVYYCWLPGRQKALPVKFSQLCELEVTYSITRHYSYQPPSLCIAKGTTQIEWLLTCRGK